MNNEPHSLHLDINGNDVHFRLECIRHDRTKCRGYSWWEESGTDILYLNLVNPTFPIPVAFAPIQYSGLHTDLGWWDEDGPILVFDTRIESLEE